MSIETELWVAKNAQWTRRGKAAIDSADLPYDVTTGNSIQAALTAAAAGATIRLGPGNYRLGAPLIVKAGQTIMGPSIGYATLTGDVTLTGWTKDGANPWWYTTSGSLPGPYSDTGQCEVNSGTDANACQRREQIWLDGVHLTRVMSTAGLTASTFYQDPTTGRTYLGTDPSSRLVEMSQLAAAISSSVTGVTLSHLEIKRFASPAQSGAIVISGSDWEVAYCQFTENHAIGLHLSTADRAHIHHNRFIKNGQLGMGHYKSNNTIVENNLFQENNTDGFWRADWESGGFKATFSNGTILRRNTSDNNEGVGLWFDIDNINVQVYENTATNNYGDGLRYEISFAAVIHDNIISGNGFRYATGGGRGADFSMFAVGAININSSPDVQIYNNTIGSNQNGIVAQMRNRGNSATFGFPRDLHNLSVHNNDIILSTGSQFGEGVVGVNTLQQTDATPYYSATKNNSFDYNTYHITTLNDRKFAWNQTYNTFAAFQATGQEAHGTIGVVNRPGFRVSASLNDGYWGDLGTATYSGTADRSYLGDYDASTFGRSAWIRMAVTIPQGATITSAALDVLPKGINGTIPTLTISADKTINSLQPTSRNDISSRPTTAASVGWTPSSWTTGTWQQSADISAILQEIVNQPSWVSGNYITFLIKSSSVSWTGTQQYITITSYDGDPASASGLVATWI